MPRLADSCSDPHGPLAKRIHDYVERLTQSRTEIFEEASRKRGPPEPVGGLDSVKRQRLGATIPAPAAKLEIPVFAPGPHTLAELFTITQDEGLKAFDVSQLSEDLVVKIGVTIMSRLDEGLLKQAVNVRSSFFPFLML